MENMIKRIYFDNPYYTQKFYKYSTNIIDGKIVIDANVHVGVDKDSLVNSLIIKLKDFNFLMLELNSKCYPLLEIIKNLHKNKQSIVILFNGLKINCILYKMQKNSYNQHHVKLKII